MRMVRVKSELRSERWLERLCRGERARSIRRLRSLEERRVREGDKGEMGKQRNQGEG